MAIYILTNGLAGWLSQHCSFAGWQTCNVVAFGFSTKIQKKKKKDIPANKFDKFKESKGKTIYYGTQAEK